MFLFATVSSAPRTLPGAQGLNKYLLSECMSEFLQQTGSWLTVYQQEMVIFLMISWDDEEDNSQGTQ